MISIYKPYLDKVAEEHFNAIIEFIARSRTKMNGSKLSTWLNTHIGISFKELILARPKHLEQIKSRFDSLSPIETEESPFDKSYRNVYTNNFSSTNSNLSSKGKQYNGFVLVERVGIETCPYCNRNSIHNTKSNRTSELDHFYDKSTYPIFAMSFFNLVPSCKVCNQLKKDKKDKFINPYDDRFSIQDEAKFKLKIKNVNYLHSEDGFDLRYYPKDNSPIMKEIENADQLFQLNYLYQYHKDYVLEILQKEVIYSSGYIDDLFKQFEGTLFKNREDLLKLVGANYFSKEKLQKRPLSKLSQDIFEQLDI